MGARRGPYVIARARSARSNLPLWREEWLSVSIPCVEEIAPLRRSNNKQGVGYVPTPAIPLRGRESYLFLPQRGRGKG